MKHVPGKFLSFLLLLCTVLQAAPYSWSVSSSKSSVYTHEAFSITYTCRFNDSGTTYVIDFDPLKSEGPYTMQVLSQNQQIENGKRVNTYTYVVFPSAAGALALNFNALMRHTTKESIENTVIGRDNMEEFDFTDTTVAVPGVNVDVKDAGLPLSGSFTMEMATAKRAVRAYEPLHLSVTIEGEGNFEALSPLMPEIEGVEVFAEAPQKDYTLTENGYRGRYVQQFAFVAKNDFTLPPFVIDYFDLAAQRAASLKSEAFTISVTPAYAAEELLDEAAPQSAGWAWKWDYLNYPLLFLLGVGAGRWLRRKKVQAEALPHWMEQVQRAGDVKSLLMLLVVHGDQRCADVIDAMEKEGEGYGLKRAKKETRACLMKG